MTDNLNLILKVLLENDVEFVLVGGLAAVLHGSSQATQDIDICAPFSTSQIEKLRKCLRNYHPYHRETPQKLSFLEHPHDLGPLRNLYLQTDLGVLDVLGEIAGIGSYEKVAKNAIPLQLFGKECKLISLEDLIKSKRTLSREKDKIGLKQLEVILEKKGK